MLALVLVMIFCVAAGAGVVSYVLLEARREGRGEFWTPEGEELIAGARRTTGKVRERGTQLTRTTAERTQVLREKLPERRVAHQTAPAPAGEHTEGSPAEGRDERDFRAAS